MILGIYGYQDAGKTKLVEEVIRALDELDDEDEDKAPVRKWLERLQKEKYRPEAPTRDDIDGLYSAVHTFFEKKLST